MLITTKTRVHPSGLRVIVGWSVYDGESDDDAPTCGRCERHLSVGDALEDEDMPDGSLQHLGDCSSVRNLLDEDRAAGKTSAEVETRRE